MNSFKSKLEEKGYTVEETSIGMWEVTKKGRQFLVETILSSGSNDRYSVYELIYMMGDSELDCPYYDELSEGISSEGILGSEVTTLIEDAHAEGSN